MPQPAWFADYAVTAQESDAGSTLSLYRRALGLRRLFQTDESLEWVETGRSDVLHFRRPNGWQVIANFGTEAYPLTSPVSVAVSSAPQDGVVSNSVPAESTVWVAPSGELPQNEVADRVFADGVD